MSQAEELRVAVGPATWTCPQGHILASEYCPWDGARRPSSGDVPTPIKRPRRIGKVIAGPLRWLGILPS
jgi:hypothetical protein